jgi:hypothetical protein
MLDLWDNASPEKRIELRAKAKAGFERNRKECEERWGPNWEENLNSRVLSRKEN